MTPSVIPSLNDAVRNCHVAVGTSPSIMNTSNLRLIVYRYKQLQNQLQPILTVEVRSGATEHVRGNRAISDYVSLAVARHTVVAQL